MSGVASLCFGFFPRAVPIRYAMTLTGLAISAGTFLLLGVTTPNDGYIAAGVFGFGIGGLMVLLPIAWADYYGRASFGAIRGIALVPADIGASGRSVAFRHCATGPAAIVCR